MQAAFDAGKPHPSYHELDHCPLMCSMTTVARGACCAMGYPTWFAYSYSETAGPIEFKFGVSLDLRNGLSDYEQIWCVARSLAMSFEQVVGDGVYLHVYTCAPHFCILRSAQPIVFKFGGWVDSLL